MRALALTVLVVEFGCGAARHATEAATAKASFAASRVRSFSDAFAVTSVADSGPNLWVGTAQGLLRFELGAGRFVTMTEDDGLPSNSISALSVDARGGVWVGTAQGISRGFHGAWQNFPPAPVGDTLAGLVAGAEGKSAWAGGSAGLAHLSRRLWERYFTDTPVTVLVGAANGVIWAGTRGKGLLRIPPPGDHVEQIGPAQGAQLAVVRALVPTPTGVVAIGEHPAGPRLVVFDGHRFYSYRIDSPQPLEWVARAGNALYVGGGQLVYQVAPPADPERAQTGPIKLVPLPALLPAEEKSVDLSFGVSSNTLDDASLPAPAARAPNAPPATHGPRLDVSEVGFRLPEGVTSVSSSERGLLVGTRFLGAVRVENGVVRHFRTRELAGPAERLSVVCAQSGDDCTFANGGAHAFRFEGNSFSRVAVDPDPETRVLALLARGAGGAGGQGDRIAVHRGPSQLRVSRATASGWTRLPIQSVTVPEGAPDVSFARLAPDGHLWLGLRAVDKEGDTVFHGAADLALDSGHVAYHRPLSPSELKHGAVQSSQLPTDLVAMFWSSPSEAWLATRSGAARWKDGELRSFTENDGLESELIDAIGPGPKGEVWVATRRGTGMFDGAHWSFPKMGPFYLKARSLGHDQRGHIFIGSEKGLYCVGDCDPEAIDSRRGLLDDAVIDLTVDPRGRVWVLTAQGISIVDP